MKLIAKERVDGKLRKRYDVARTPLQRVTAADQPPNQALLDVRLLAEQNPLALKRRIDRTIAAMPALLEVTRSA